MLKTLNSETKILIGIIVATLAILIGGMILVSRPAPTIEKASLVPADAYTKGNKDATVTLVEFSDFQCPACKAIQPSVEQITNTYKDKVLFVYRHYPLTQHPYSQQAARAAEAAGEQGKFFEMGTYLFNNQDKLSDETVYAGAKELKLDEEKFKKDFTSGKYDAKIQKDIAEGTKFGVNSTPSFFLNGQKINLATQASLENAVKEAIK